MKSVDTQILMVPKDLMMKNSYQSDMEKILRKFSQACLDQEETQETPKYQKYIKERNQ